MRFVSIALTATVLACTAQAASAETATSFRGFRVQADVGGNRFQSQGVHDDKFGFGVSGGFDGVIGEKFVVGPDFSWWRSRGENFTPGVAGGTVAHKSFEELGAGIRAGYLVNPKLLVYGIGGYVNSEQRKAFTGVNGVGGYYNHFHTDGYQLGGGAEYSLTNRFYVGAGYRYSQYDDHTARQRLFASVGVRFP